MRGARENVTFLIREVLEKLKVYLYEFNPKKVVSITGLSIRSRPYTPEVLEVSNLSLA